MIGGFPNPLDTHSVLDSSSPPTTAWSTGCNSVGSNSSISSQCFNFSHSTNTNNRSPTSTYSGSSFGHSRLSPTLSDPEYPVLPPLLPLGSSSSITSSLQSPSSDLHCLLQRSGSHSVDSTTSSIQSLSDPSSPTSYGSAIHRSNSFASAIPQNIESGYSSG